MNGWLTRMCRKLAAAPQRRRARRRRHKQLRIAVQQLRQAPHDMRAYQAVVEFFNRHERPAEIIKLWEKGSEEIREAYTIAIAISNRLFTLGDSASGERVRRSALGVELPEAPDFRSLAVRWMLGHSDSVASAHASLAAWQPPSVGQQAPQRARQAPHPCMVQLDDALVLSGEWLVACGDELLLDLHFGTPTALDSYYLPAVGGWPHHLRQLDEGGVLQQVAIPRPESAIAQPCYLIGGDANYFHWTLDFCPRLAALAAERRLAPGSVLVHGNLMPFQREMLHLAGVSESMLRPTAYPASYRCTKLLVPLFDRLGTWRRPHVDPRGVAWARHLTRKARAAAHREAGKMIYIDRRDSRRRRLLGEELLIHRLRRRGFQIVVLGGMTVAQQARLFARAEIIVGLHGAGLTNMTYAPPGCLVVELVSASWSVDYFRRLAEACGHRFRQVQCQAAARPDATPLHWNVHLTVAQVDEVLAAVSPGGEERAAA